VSSAGAIAAPTAGACQVPQRWLRGGCCSAGGVACWFAAAVRACGGQAHVAAPAGASVRRAQPQPQRRAILALLRDAGERASERGLPSPPQPQPQPQPLPPASPPPPPPPPATRHPPPPATMRRYKDVAIQNEVERWLIANGSMNASAAYWYGMSMNSPGKGPRWTAAAARLLCSCGCFGACAWAAGARLQGWSTGCRRCTRCGGSCWRGPRGSARQPQLPALPATLAGRTCGCPGQPASPPPHTDAAVWRGRGAPAIALAAEGRMGLPQRARRGRAPACCSPSAPSPTHLPSARPPPRLPPGAEAAGRGQSAGCGVSSRHTRGPPALLAPPAHRRMVELFLL
jgi:hypothetical protein